MSYLILTILTNKNQILCVFVCLFVCLQDSNSRTAKRIEFSDPALDRAHRVWLQAPYAYRGLGLLKGSFRPLKIRVPIPILWVTFFFFSFFSSKNFPNMPIILYNLKENF